MVIELPRIELQKDFYVTIDKRLNEVRFLQIFVDGSRQLNFVPMRKIRELCEMI